jgi:hypothetical protein
MEATRHVILFHPDLIPLIESGAKTLTYRLDDDGLDYLAIGDRVEAVDAFTDQAFAQLEITGKESTTFGQLPTDRQGNVTHSSKEKQRIVFQGYYGREVKDSDRVLILGFRLIGWLGDMR